MSERQGDASATADAAAVLPSRMDRFIDKIEFLAAVFIGIVAADVFITVVLRWFNTSIPDSYNFGQFLLGIFDFLGHCRHLLPRYAHHRRCCVGQRRSQLATRLRRVRNTGVAVRRQRANLYAVRQNVSTYYSNLETIELRLPVWPFFAVAWLSDVSAVMLIAVRTYRLVFQPASMARPSGPATGVE
jgi:hypothetical protein